MSVRIDGDSQRLTETQPGSLPLATSNTVTTSQVDSGDSLARVESASDTAREFVTAQALPRPSDAKKAYALRATPVVPKSVPRETIPIPPFRQSDSSTCGVAALMSVMAYYGLGEDINEKDLRKILHTTHDDGTEPPPIKKFAEKIGLNVDISKNMSIAELRELANRGIPVMVQYQAYSDRDETKQKVLDMHGKGQIKPLHNPDGTFNWENDYRDGHYSIVLGVTDKYIFLQDPSNGFGRGVIPIDEFEKRWHDTDDHNLPRYPRTGLIFTPKVPPQDLHEVYIEDCQYIP
jgi:predicted double-glycine peptidase